MSSPVVNFGATTQQRVLEIPEIVELIFSFLDEKSNTNNAVVCRKWSDIALNVLWRDVKDIRRLFSLLAPLRLILSRVEGDVIDIHTFARTLDVSDWERFRSYARRVRSLHVDEREDQLQPLVASDAFDEVSRTRVSLNILPHLRQLTWITGSLNRMRHSLMFQHENVTEFAIYLHRKSTYPISTFFKEVKLRMPQLKALDLRFNFPAREIEDDLAELFSGLPKLKKVILPMYTCTTSVMERLSALQELDTIQFEFMESQGRGEINDVMSFEPRLEEGAFPALMDLSLNVRLSDMTRFLGGSFAPSNLTTLYVHTLTASSPGQVTDFLNAVADNCQLLRHLYLDFITSADIAPDLEQPQLTWQALRPVLSCPNLVQFELRWATPCDLTLADVQEIATKWPSIEVLMLNCEPVYTMGPPTLDLRALVPFARHCPKLVELGLYVSGSVPDSYADDPLCSVKPFRSLQRLSLGTSPITDAGAAALFLSELCPQSCDVLAGVTLPEGFAVRDDVADEESMRILREQLQVWYDGWREVGRMLPLLTRLRAQERARRAALEAEVDDLRVRYGLLADRAKFTFNAKADGTCIAF